MKPEIIEDALAAAAAYPQMHRQDDFGDTDGIKHMATLDELNTCGSTMCLAGFICIQGGCTLSYRGYRYKGHSVSAFQFATVRAELTPDQAEELFCTSCADDLGQLKERWARLKREAGVL